MKPIHVGLPLEVLTTIGEQLNCRKTLRILSELSHDFRKIFAPLLFSKLVITGRKIGKLERRELDDPPWLQCVKKFEFRSHLCLDYEEDAFQRPPIVMKVLQNMPNLTTFRWGTMNWITEDVSPRGLVLPFDVLTMLRDNCSKLRLLSLNLHRFPFGTKVEGEYHFPFEQIPIFDIHSFRNLAALEVFGIYGNLKVQARNFAVVLAESPQLTSLALSVQESAFEQEYGSTNLEDLELELNKFCWRMCSIFSDELNQAPLSLRRLHLGRVLEMTLTDLLRLTDPVALEQVYQFAGGYEEIIPIYYRDPNFMVFSYENCPNLWEICTPQLSNSNESETLLSMLNSWPMIEVNGKHMSPWDQVQKTRDSRIQVYRRTRSIPKDFDDRYAPGL